MMTVTVYTAGPSCQACTLTKRHLDRIGVAYEEVPMGQDALVVDAMKFCDFTQAPVVCASVNGEEIAFDGYRPDRLNALRGVA